MVVREDPGGFGSSRAGSCSGTVEKQVCNKGLVSKAWAAVDTSCSRANLSSAPSIVLGMAQLDAVS